MRVDVGPIVVITDVNSELGRPLAHAFYRRGVQVIGFRQPWALPAEMASTAPKGAFTAMTVDVADESEVRSAFAVIRERWGGASILFNIADVDPHIDFLQESGSSFMRTISLNLGGVVTCTRAALETMTVTGRGRIINVGSFAGTVPATSGSAYSVSMGAARIFTQALVADLADRFPDIVINTWVPGLARSGSTSSVSSETAANWGVDLALRGDRSLNGVEFDRDCELVQTPSFKRRMIDKLRGRTRVPRTLGRTDHIFGLT